MYKCFLAMMASCLTVANAADLNISNNSAVVIENNIVYDSSVYSYHKKGSGPMNDDIKNPSPQVTKDYSNILNSSINSISNSGMLNIVVNIGKEMEPKITVKSPEGLLKNLDIKVQGSELKIATIGSFKTQSNISVSISLPSLKNIYSKGSGDITGSIQSDSLNIMTSGSGNVTLNGNVKTLLVNGDGSGDAILNSLVADSVIINSDDSGNINVLARNSVNAQLSSSGDINIYGNPPILNESVLGSGQINQKSAVFNTRPKKAF